MSDKILFVGSPGSGKGTQAELLEQCGFKHISTGELIRRALREDNSLILPYRKIVEGGGLLPDKIIFKLIEEEVRGVSKYVLDGAVRTLEQAKYVFSKKLVEAVFYFRVGEEIAFHRILGRGEGRADDNPKVVRKRLELYEEKTAPVLDYLEEHFEFYEIDANKSIFEINKEVLEKLKIG